MNDDRGRTPIVVVAMLVAAVGVALLLTGWLRSRPTTETATASFPVEAGGLKTISVRDALLIQAGDDSSNIAVAGWFQQTFVLSCPFTLVPPVPVIEGPCALTGWLMAGPESIVHVTGNGMDTNGPHGPALQTAFDGPGIRWANPLPKVGDSAPTPVVLVGHFNDPRAPRCQPENRQECADRFVVTAVAWANGIQNP
jgi:hypothetical protein